jgi:hypothetical protein
MTEFEDFGRWLDEEIQHVREVIKKEIQPTAEKKFVSALKKASAKLAEMADEIEKRKARSGS